MSQPGIAAIFAPQTPSDQGVAPDKPDFGGDDGFQSFMDDAAHKVSPAAENNKSDTDRQDRSAAQSSATKKPTEKHSSSASKETNQTASKEPLNKSNAATRNSENISPQELASVDNYEQAVNRLKELGFGPETIETLLEFLESNSGVNAATLLQSLMTQISQINDSFLKDFLTANSSDQNFLAQQQNRQNLISDLLKQAGLTNQEAKDFIQKFQSMQNNASNLKDGLTEQVRAASNEDADLQPEVLNQALKDAINENISKQKNGEKIQSKQDLMAQLDSKAKAPEPTDQKSSMEKLLHQEGNQPQKNTNSVADEKSAFKNTILEKATIQNNLQGTNQPNGNALDATTSKNLEAIKANGDVQVQNVNAAGENNQKTASTVKSMLPENSIYKAPVENRVIDQIINRISMRSNGSQSEVKIRLDPPSLGTVRLHITTSGDGVRTVIVAESLAVKQVIENNLSQLRDAMAEQGLKMNGFSVLVGGDGNSGSFQQGEHSNPSDSEFSDLMDPNEPTVESNEEPATSSPHRIFDISQTVSVIA